MNDASQASLADYCRETAHRAKAAAQVLSLATCEQKNQWLLQSAGLLAEHEPAILKANQRDLDAASDYGLNEAQIDRLRLDSKRLEQVATGLQQIAQLPDPVGQVIQSSRRPNGLEISKVRVPLGVIFFIYESRPNVTADAAAICLKSGNAVILRGGKEAAHSSRALVERLKAAASENGLPSDAIQLVATTDREAVRHFLQLDRYVDLAIPRGGEGLIRRVTQQARMPVIKHYQGICHVYIDRAAEPEMALQITLNAKCQRQGVCNACESLLVHDQIAPSLLPEIGRQLIEKGVEIRADRQALQWIPGAVAASDEDFRTEYLGPVIAVKTVASLDEAVQHIQDYGSQHTDAIVTSDLRAARSFAARVDSSAVMINASTRFNDGGEIGMGAEIGISTDKFHARGPCGLNELTSYKYIVQGEGHVRR